VGSVCLQLELEVLHQLEMAARAHRSFGGPRGSVVTTAQVEIVGLGLAPTNDCAPGIPGPLAGRRGRAHPLLSRSHQCVKTTELYSLASEPGSVGDR
jgi:hypothetical protein